MFEETLVRGTKDSLALLGDSCILQEAYLAGGTAIALQLGHRISVDFNFFTSKQFVPGIVAAELKKLGPFVKERADRGTVLGEFAGVKFSLFAYQYPLIFPALDYLSLHVADLRDIAAMKIDAVAARGLMRDFVDLYFICQAGYRLDELLGFYQKKYGKLSSNIIHLQKSLVFFHDAEVEEMPRMLRAVEWEEVKDFFIKEIKALTGKLMI